MMIFFSWPFSSNVKVKNNHIFIISFCDCKWRALRFIYLLYYFIILFNENRLLCIKKNCCNQSSWKLTELVHLRNLEYWLFLINNWLFHFVHYKLHNSLVPHTDCTQVDRGVTWLSQRKEVVLYVTMSWNASISKRQCLGPPWGMLFSEVRKRRDKLEHYSTTIKQLQGPQLRSYMLPLSHTPLPLSFTSELLTFDTPLPQPHDLTHSALWVSSHTSVLPLHTKQLGSSWNRTSQWNESNSTHQ